ncbi:MAG: NAD(P)/FAD-dependent oxidoreductase [Coriobacteriales bacterium]|jgi:sarcosine oxidase subunit beta
MSIETKSASIVIIGGGIVACATAYNLAKRGMTDVIVLEKAEIGNGGSCRNAGGVRQSARDVRELPLAMYAVGNIWPTLSDELGCDVEYVQKGNLRLGLTEAHRKTLGAHVAKSTKVGLDVKMIEGDEAREICPAMSEEVLCASWCPTDGHANPLKTTLAYYQRALAMGVTFVTGVEVTGLRKDHGRVRFIDTTDGAYEAEQVLLCAGFESRPIAQTVGIDIPVVPRRNEVLVTEMCPHLFDVMIGVAGGEFYGGQTEHGSFLMGGNNGLEAFTSEHHSRFSTDSITAPSISRGIIKYFPSLEGVKIIRTWSGYYDACADVVPVIDAIPEAPGLVCAFGFSGHGFGIAPATGLALSEILMDGESTTIDVSALSYDRFAAKG